MKLFLLVAAIAPSLKEGVAGFSVSSIATSSRPATSSRTTLRAFESNDEQSNLQRQHNVHRRTVLSNLLKATTLPLFIAAVAPSTANAAIPSVTSSEFDVILKDSAKSILSVELSGPKSETAIVKLVDGTTFTISDLVESSTDPRSPLKLVARCRLYNIPVKNTGLVSALSGEGSIISTSGKKKKSYMNTRVQEAQKKEAEKRERMAEDERERLEELYKMEGNEKGFLE